MIKMSSALCCHLGCDAPVEFEIYDEADRAPDAGTEACEAHVGALLGHRAGVEPRGPSAFRVVALARWEEAKR